MSDEAQGNLVQDTITETPATETGAEASDDILDALETGTETAGDEAPKGDESKPLKLKVKIDGQELEVDADEAARGYQRQADYSRNMQKLQAEMQVAQQLKARYQQQLEQFIPESEQRIRTLHQTAEQYRLQGNVEELALVQYDLNAEIMRYQQAQAEQQRITGEQQEQAKQQRQVALQNAERAVLESIPEWKNRDVRRAEAQDVSRTLNDFVGRYYGEMAPQIMADINDGVYGPMPVVLARKAMLYDKLMEKVAARKAGQSEMTKAPAPVSTVRSSGGASKDPDKMSSAEWMAWRNKQVRSK